MPRPRNADPATRLARLADGLRGRAALTAEFAADLGVTTRTIRRDVARLRAAGVNVVGSNQGGIWIE